MSLTDFKAKMNKSRINKYKINNNNKTNTNNQLYHKSKIICKKRVTCKKKQAVKATLISLCSRGRATSADIGRELRLVR
jgi:hypothetical protein